MTDGVAFDADYEADLERGRLLIEMRDLAFAIADELCAFDIQTWHYTVVSDGVEWSDLKMLHNADMAPRVERALRYLQLRGWLVYNPAFLNLVRVEAPAPPAAPETTEEAPPA